MREAVRDNHRKLRARRCRAQSYTTSCGDIFCDWYIEIAKQGLYTESEETKRTTQEVLLYVLTGILKLLHPYMPFITEEVYGYLPGHEGMLITSKWPEVKPGIRFCRRSRTAWRA